MKKKILFIVAILCLVVFTASCNSTQEDNTLSVNSKNATSESHISENGALESGASQTSWGTHFERPNRPPTEISQSSYIKLTTEHESYGANVTTITLTITNNTEEVVAFARFGYHLQRLSNDQWRDVRRARDERVMPDFGGGVPGGQEREISINLQRWHSLLPGQYRIVLPIGSDPTTVGEQGIIAEFTIVEN